MVRVLVRQTILLVASLASSAALMAVLVGLGLVGVGRDGPSDLSLRSPTQVATHLATQLHASATAAAAPVACVAESSGGC